MNLITITTFLPLIGAILLLLVSLRGSENQKAANNLYRYVTLAVTLVTFVVSLLILVRYDNANSLAQLVQKTPWIGSLGVNYHVGVDGLSIWLVLLTTFLMPVSVLASWHITKRVREYMLFMLILET